MGGKGGNTGKGRKKKIKKEQKSTDKFGRMLIALGRKKKWKKQEIEGTIRKVIGEESEKYTVLKFREQWVSKVMERL